MNAKAQIIELLGLPGAGKTTLAAKLALDQKAKVVNIANRWEGYLFCGLYLVRHPFNTWTLYAWLRRESRATPGLLAHKRHLFIQMMAKEAKAGLLGGNLIIDDGLAQFWLTLPEAPLSPDEVRKLFSTIDKKVVIVIVESTAPVRLRRLKERGREPRAFLGEDYLKDWRLAIEQNYQTLRRAVVAHFRSVVIIT